MLASSWLHARHVALEADLLRAVLEAPEDVEARRVYGDALASRGDPRGELIHVQCELEADTCDRATRTQLLRREAVLLGKHRNAWIAPISVGHRGNFHRTGTFRRGMVEKVSAPARVLVRNMAAITAREPVTSLSIVELTPEATQALGASSLLRRVRRFHASGYERRASIGEGFLTQQTFPSLEDLDLGPRLSGPEVVSGLLMDPLFYALSGLTLHGEDMLKELFERLPSTRLRSIGFRSLSPPGSDFDLVPRALAAIEGLALEHLDLTGNRINADAVGALAAAPFARRLRRVSLGLFRDDVPFTKLGAFDGVEELELAGHLRPELALHAWPNLRHLLLEDCTFEIAEAIGRAPWALRSFQVTRWNWRMTAEVARALSQARWRSTLRKLVLPFVDDASISALCSAEWPELETIRIRGSALTDVGMAALAAAPMPALAYVELVQNELRPPVLKPLRARLGKGLVAVPAIARW
jgi:uncharacterized protein (TIGR02996 family)